MIHVPHGRPMAVDSPTRVYVSLTAVSDRRNVSAFVTRMEPGSRCCRIRLRKTLVQAGRTMGNKLLSPASRRDLRVCLPSSTSIVADDFHSLVSLAQPLSIMAVEQGL